MQLAIRVVAGVKTKGEKKEKRKKAGYKEERALDISISSAVCCDEYAGFIKRNISFGHANSGVLRHEKQGPSRDRNQALRPGRSGFNSTESR